MKILNSAQTREWDAFTIRREPISSLELMERAGQRCAEYLHDALPEAPFLVFCGTGNNGGDGLVIARVLQGLGHVVRVAVAGDPGSGSRDFQLNLERVIRETSVVIDYLNTDSGFPIPQDSECVVDALLGSGINRPADGWLAGLINHINHSSSLVVSVDIPSGFQPDLMDVQAGAIITADLTLLLQRPIPSLLFEENGHYQGEPVIIDIGLHPDFPDSAESNFHMLTLEEAAEWLPLRSRFGHKYTHGHVQVMAGSRGRMGAAVLCAKSALRSGAGAVTASIPACGLDIMQVALPEVMVDADSHAEVLAHSPILPKADVVAIGPGIGTAPETSLLLRRILGEAETPLVIDADALNLIGTREMLSKLPAGSVLTPHAGEFARLFGPTENSFERLDLLISQATSLQVTIVLKGAYTLIAQPDGSVWFNLTGNPGLATAGSGDVLTGIIAAMIARGVSSEEAAVLGVFLHGLAGDCAAESLNAENMVAGDLIEFIPNAVNLIRET